MQLEQSAALDTQLLSTAVETIVADLIGELLDAAEAAAAAAAGGAQLLVGKEAAPHGSVPQLQIDKNGSTLVDACDLQDVTDVLLQSAGGSCGAVGVLSIGSEAPVLPMHASERLEELGVEEDVSEDSWLVRVADVRVSARAATTTIAPALGGGGGCDKEADAAWAASLRRPAPPSASAGFRSSRSHHTGTAAAYAAASPAACRTPGSLIRPRKSCGQARTPAGTGTAARIPRTHTLRSSGGLPAAPLGAAPANASSSAATPVQAGRTRASLEHQQCRTPGTRGGLAGGSTPGRGTVTSPQLTAAAAAAKATLVSPPSAAASSAVSSSSSSSRYSLRASSGGGRPAAQRSGGGGNSASPPRCSPLPSMPMRMTGGSAASFAAAVGVDAAAAILGTPQACSSPAATSLPELTGCNSNSSSKTLAGRVLERVDTPPSKQRLQLPEGAAAFEAPLPLAGELWANDSTAVDAFMSGYDDVLRSIDDAVIGGTPAPHHSDAVTVTIAAAAASSGDAPAGRINSSAILSVGSRSKVGMEAAMETAINSGAGQVAAALAEDEVAETLLAAPRAELDVAPTCNASMPPSLLGGVTAGSNDSTAEYEAEVPSPPRSATVEVVAATVAQAAVDPPAPTHSAMVDSNPRHASFQEPAMQQAPSCGCFAGLFARHV